MKDLEINVEKTIPLNGYVLIKTDKPAKKINTLHTPTNEALKPIATIVKAPEGSDLNAGQKVLFDPSYASTFIKVLDITDKEHFYFFVQPHCLISILEENGDN